MLQFQGQWYLDGRASDPRELGWMRGSPPPVDKRITFESGAFLDPPHNRWSLSHMRELMATVNVWRGGGPAHQFERSDKTSEIDALRFVDTNGRTCRFNEALFDTYTDGILVLHRGQIIYERYFGALEPHLPHLCMSVTKSYAGTLAAALIHESVLDDSKMIPYYLPELRGTGWQDATLRQLMDMQVGLAYDEVYTDKHSSVWELTRASNELPRPVDYAGPRTLCDYLRSLRKEGEHGKTFAYASVNTDVIAWVMARVTGYSFAQLLQKRFWAPLGCEENGYISVDPAGMALANGGLSATLRDLGRFGELVRREGEWGGKQLIPASVVDDVRNGDHPAKLPGGYSYRSQWWITHDELGAVEARGVNGQRIYIAPGAEMVVARFASHPLASSASGDVVTSPQFLALGRMLRE